ncbi:MAG: T9SS type A sorting domain-containing protein, partial [Dehalococcoidia bacterium]|nr:T9SS type A sorting domain-containing protein [Dehalococcoidia bacterium]
EYPSQSPLKTAGFNVPRFSDLDGDGDSELFAGVQSGVYGTNFVKNFVYYTNKGSDTLANFIHERDNFLEILDLGSASVPVFADIDLDGDEDLFIGNEFNDELPGLRGTVFFFRNIGEIESPVFKLEDSTFFPDLNGNNLAPTFGDLDSDGDLDAVVGDWNGKLYYCENSGTPESPSFLYKGQFLDTDVGGLAHPALGDLDLDGDLDLIVGQDDGLIYYFINIGTSSQSILELQSENFFPNTNLGVQAAPYLADLDDDGDLDILLGNADGELFFAEQEKDIWSVTKIANFPYAGPKTSPAAAHLNGDDKLDLMLGTWHGGLQLYKIDMSSATVEFALLPTEIGQLNTYPNPFNGRLTVFLTIPSAEILNISVWNLLGEKVGTINDGPLPVGRHRFSWKTGELSSGIYFIRAESDGGTKPWHTVRKVIYLK